MTRVVIALGGNLPSGLGKASATLSQAVNLLKYTAGVHDIQRSRWFRSPAVPAGSGPDFINGAASFNTGLSAQDVLDRLHEIELELGRTRTARWEPRVCDLDLIAVEDAVLPDRETLEAWMALDRGKAQTVTPPRLILPHPRMQERAFVLIPMRDVAPDWLHPVLGLDVGQMLDALPPSALEGIVPVEEAPSKRPLGGSEPM